MLYNTIVFRGILLRTMTFVGVTVVGTPCKRSVVISVRDSNSSSLLNSNFLLREFICDRVLQWTASVQSQLSPWVSLPPSPGQGALPIGKGTKLRSTGDLEVESEGRPLDTGVGVRRTEVGILPLLTPRV